MLVEYPLEAVGNALRFGRRNLAYGAIFLATAAAFYEPGVTYVNKDSGKGFRADYFFKDGIGLRFRLGLRGEGIRPVPCGEDQPLVPTAHNNRQIEVTIDTKGMPRVEDFTHTVSAGAKEVCRENFWKSFDF